MTDETRTRFLASIAAQVPIERVAEVHLFPAIRQGGMESGVAVIAVERAGESADELRAQLEQIDAMAADDPVDAPALDAATVTDVDTLEDDTAAEAAELDDVESELAVADDDEPAAPRRAPQRYTVYSARYRHTLKGPDRGKWEVAVTEEADAPLLTVDAVVRGVQRRSGDADEIVRLSGDEVRSALPVTAAS